MLKTAFSAPRLKTGVMLALALFLSGCTTFPVYAKFDDPQKTLMQGSATSGSINMQSLSGVSCEGDFPMMESSVTMQTELTCSDGRTGTALVTFNNWQRETGYGHGVLSDGTEFQIFIGSVSSKMPAPKMFK